MHGYQNSIGHAKDCKTKSIRLHAHKVKKIMAATFILTII